MSTKLAAARPSREQALGVREQLILMACGSWMIAGLFVDGWAHANQEPETFFTPWHALLYSGFAAAAVWMAVLVRRPGIARDPGFRLGLVGLGVFTAGGAGDLVWHEIFGVEVDLEALLSPTHLLLFSGGILFLSVPLRSAWPRLLRETRAWQLLPVLSSATLCCAASSFFIMYLSPFRRVYIGGPAATEFRTPAIPAAAATAISEKLTIIGIAGFLVFSIVLVSWCLLLTWRWTPPLGTFTIMFAVVAFLGQGLSGFESPIVVLSGAFGGITADACSARKVPPAVLGAIVPAVTWTSYVVAWSLVDTVTWSVELWAGTVSLSAMAGGALGLLVAALSRSHAMPASESSWPTRHRAFAVDTAEL